jgi:hypothetical protein
MGVVKQITCASEPTQERHERKPIQGRGCMIGLTVSALRQPMHLEPADMEVQRTAEK